MRQELTLAWCETRVRLSDGPPGALRVAMGADEFPRTVRRLPSGAAGAAAHLGGVIFGDDPRTLCHRGQHALNVRPDLLPQIGKLKMARLRTANPLGQIYNLCCRLNTRACARILKPRAPN